MANLNDDTPPEYSEGDRVRVHIPKPDPDDYDFPVEHGAYRAALRDHQRFDDRTGTVTSVLNRFQYEVEFDNGDHLSTNPPGIMLLEGDLEALGGE